jgi:hypothetical protein
MAKTPAKPAKPPAQRTGTTSAKPNNGDREITISGSFRTVFFTTTGLTLVFVALAVILTLFGDDTAKTKHAVEGLFTMAKIGFGAIVGLLGGKSL